METSVVLSALGCLLAVLCLMYLAYKQITPIAFSIVASVVVALFSGLPIFETVSGTFAVETGSYVGQYLLLFVFSAIMGRIYQETGAAKTVANGLAKVFGANHPFIPIMLATIILSYAGISNFVSIYAIYPIALELCHRANINKRLIPGCFCCAAWAVAQVAPGSTQIHNIVPMEYLGTGAMAGALPGFLTAALMAVLSILYLNRQVKKQTSQGIVFDSYDELGTYGQDENAKTPPMWMALAPVVVTVVLFDILGINVTIAVAAGDLISLVLMYKYIKPKEWVQVFSEGAESSIGVLLDISLIIGFGAVVVLTPFYSTVIDWVANSNWNPYILAPAASAVFAGILGSSSSSIALTMETLGDILIEYGVQGYNMDFIHRLVCQAAITLDSLPHCGALLATFSVCKLTHKQSYGPVFVTTVVIPLIAVFLFEVPLCMILG